MAIIKCKMCGGDLHIFDGASTAECEYCGSVQTVPKVDDEKKLTLFARANRLRTACEFDKAAGVYETIVADFPEEAESYWGLVLCKYGIEYVDDPATGKKIPTCHRSSFDSVMEDSDFEQALENADAVARKVYREEAKAIEEIRKGIIAVSNNEQPYDIFICYKETAENGERTLDSVLAQDVYDALTDKGYRVFFSRITLEDKLGMEYEPYIFAALNSAKVMLVFGTDYEYFNAVWVKNEWSRFLKLMAKDKEKHLIPCFKGIDAYDMPKEFARLQAQDLGKVGATQDLLRGIEKILPKQKAETIVQERVVVGGSGDNKVAALLERGNMALEDGDWAKADSFFEDVLNNDAKNAQAYLGKTLAQERCRTLDAFIRKRKDASEKVSAKTLYLTPNHAHIDEMVKKCSVPNYVGADKIRKLYEFDLSYTSEAPGRSEQYHKEKNYWENHKQLSRAEKFAVGAVAENLAKEKKAFLTFMIDRTKKAEEVAKGKVEQLKARYAQHIQRADEQAESLYNDGLKRRDEDYDKWLFIAKNSDQVSKLKETAKKFEELKGYKDSVNLAKHCLVSAQEIQAKLDAEAEAKRIQDEKAAAIRAKKEKKNRIITVTVIAAVVIALVVLTKVVIPSNNYKKADGYLTAGQYEEAIEAFEKLGEYKDSATKLQMAVDAKIERDNNAAYESAMTMIAEERFVEAYDELIALGDYKDSAAKAEEIYPEYKLQRLRNAQVGERIVFGSYEQDGDEKNGKEPIEWIVLDAQGDRRFLLSAYALDNQNYHFEEADITWEDATIRQWLNEDFYNAAFNEAERRRIPEVTVLNPDNTKEGTLGGNDTVDKVFFLSVDEFETYVPDESKVCYTAKSVWKDKPEECRWWLRTPGWKQSTASFVYGNGNTYGMGEGVEFGCSVRPAMWVDVRDFDTARAEADVLAENGDYDAAYELYSIVGDTERIAEIEVLAAPIAEASGELAKAVEWYKFAGDTENAQRVEYAYVKSHYDSRDITTYQYMLELKEAQYLDSESLFAQLYAVKIDLFCNTVYNDYTTRYTRINYSDGRPCFHYQILGGEPGQNIQLKYVYETRLGINNPSKYNEKDRRTATVTVSDEVHTPFTTGVHSGSNVPYHRLTIYNAETEEQLAQLEVYTPYDR